MDVEGRTIGPYKKNEQEKNPVPEPRGKIEELIDLFNFGQKFPDVLKPQSNLGSPLNNNVEIGRFQEDEDGNELSQLFANAVALGSQLNPGGTGQTQLVPVPIEIAGASNGSPGSASSHWGYTFQSG